MQAQIRIGTRRDLKLQNAVLIYRDDSMAFATLHEVRADNGKTPYLGPGQPVTTGFLRPLAKSLGASVAPEFLPESVLATTPVPDEVNVDSIAGWERAYFESAFTHPSGAVRLTSHPGGFFGLWSSLANNDIPFPVKYLTDAKQMLREFNEGNEER